MTTRPALPFTQLVVECRPASTPRPARAPCVLVVMKNRVLQKTVARVVRGSGARVIEAAHLAGLAAMEEPLDLAICDLDDMGDSASQTLMAARQHASGTPPPVLLMSERELDPLLAPLVPGAFFNVIGKVAKDGSFNASDLLTTMRKLVDRDIFGVEKYVHWGALLHRFPIASTNDIPALLACFASFMEDLEYHGRRSRELVTVAEELITNALYNAATDENGLPIYAHRHRNDPVELPADRPAELSYATDGHVLAVAVRDSYGSLNAQSVLRGLQRCAAQGEDQVRMAETAGGAGIGLYMIYQYADQLVINLRPGFATEFIAIVELGLKQRDRRTSGRCLNLFTTIDQRSSETAV